MDYSVFAKTNKQYLNLARLFESDRLSHVCLLESRDTLLAESICYALCAEITGAKYDQIAKHIHPDVLVYGDGGKIDVAAVSEIIETLAVRPYSCKNKVYCLLQIENMNETAQNKLLKSLEESPKDVIFLLTSANTKNVLPTVLSRCATYKIDNLSDGQILELLLALGTKKEVAEIAVSCAGGNSTLAQKLTNEKFVQLYLNVLDMLLKINGSKDCLEFASKFDSKSIDKQEILDICMLLVRDVAMILAGQKELVTSKHHIRELEQIAKTLSLTSCTAILDVCAKCKEDLNFNASGAAAVDKLVLVIAEEKTKCRKLLA